MIKVLYITSTLGKSGPTNQTFNIIKNLDKKTFSPIILTLSPEPLNSMWQNFENLGIEMQSLNLSRLGLLFVKKRIKKLIQEIDPDIIHTQHIRADNLLASLEIDIPWCLTLRGYPFEEFVMNYGPLLGNIIAKSHISAIRKCKNVVACSKALAERFRYLNINTISIQNGVVIKEGMNTIDSSVYSKPIFITTGGLMRKNVDFVIESFNLYINDNQGRGSLIVLGDEPDLCKKYAGCENVYFYGKIDNIWDYYRISDYYISAALSEGLPNAVLEALSCGVPVLLSDIPSHKEINSEFPIASSIFALNDDGKGLTELLKSHTELFSSDAKLITKMEVCKKFSDKAVSMKYQEFYINILHSKKNIF